ncbi:uncharacterized protein [Ptychodera flava]|uniref:uncharacterized protein n=1 Tax=Ptychodera flava TaxID=63121 RepID=UPI00396AAC55
MDEKIANDDDILGLQDICKELEERGQKEDRAKVDTGSIDTSRFSILPVKVHKDLEKELDEHFQASKSSSEVYVTKRTEKTKSAQRVKKTAKPKLASERKEFKKQHGIKNKLTQKPKTKFQMSWFFRSLQEKWQDLRIGTRESGRTLHHLKTPHVIRIRHSWPLFQEMRKAYGFMHQSYDAFILFAMVHLKQIVENSKGSNSQPSEQAPQRTNVTLVDNAAKPITPVDNGAKPSKCNAKKLYKIRRRKRLIRQRAKLEEKPMPTTEYFAHPSYFDSSEPHLKLKPLSSLGEELRYATAPNCIVSVDQLRSVFSLVRCQKCQGSVSIIEEIRKGVCIVISFQCQLCSHVGKWYSSEMYYGHFVINLILVIAYVLSGEPNMHRLTRLLSFMNLGTVQNSYKIIHAMSDVILQAAKNQMRKIQLDLLQTGEPVILQGDGRSDSPGMHATKHTYTLMMAETNKIVFQKHLDVREVDGKSTTMEIVCARASMTAVQDMGINVTEFVTDDHFAITSMMQEERFRAIQYSKDMWHKAKNIAKKLILESRLKANKVLVPWIPAIRKHFYFAAQHCNGDPDTMREIVHQFLHHIRGEHAWEGGHCTFHPRQLPPAAKRLTYLSQNSSAYKVVQKLLCRKTFVDSLKYYVRNRSTGTLESYHNVILKYASKRCYRGRTYEMCVSLATIDHNSHTDINKRDGHPVKNRRAFNKLSKKWALLTLSPKKTYDYITELMAHCIQNMIPTEKVKLDRFVPRYGLGGPNPPSTEQLKVSYMKHKLKQKRVYPWLEQTTEPETSTILSQQNDRNDSVHQAPEGDRYNDVDEPLAKKQAKETNIEQSRSEVNCNDNDGSTHFQTMVDHQPNNDSETQVQGQATEMIVGCSLLTEKDCSSQYSQPPLVCNFNTAEPDQVASVSTITVNHSNVWKSGEKVKGNDYIRLDTNHMYAENTEPVKEMSGSGEAATLKHSDLALAGKVYQVSTLNQCEQLDSMQDSESSVGSAGCEEKHEESVRADHQQTVASESVRGIKVERKVKEEDVNIDSSRFGDHHYDFDEEEEDPPTRYKEKTQTIIQIADTSPIDRELEAREFDRMDVQRQNCHQSTKADEDRSEYTAREMNVHHPALGENPWLEREEEREMTSNDCTDPIESPDVVLNDRRKENESILEEVNSVEPSCHQRTGHEQTTPVKLRSSEMYSEMYRGTVLLSEQSDESDKSDSLQLTPDQVVDLEVEHADSSNQTQPVERSALQLEEKGNDPNTQLQVSVPEIKIGGREMTVSFEFSSEYVCENDTEERPASPSDAGVTVVKHLKCESENFDQCGPNLCDREVPAESHLEKRENGSCSDMQRENSGVKLAHQVTANDVSVVTLPEIQIGDRGLNIVLDLAPEYVCNGERESESAPSSDTQEQKAAVCCELKPSEGDVPTTDIDQRLQPQTVEINSSKGGNAASTAGLKTETEFDVSMSTIQATSKSVEGVNLSAQNSEGGFVQDVPPECVHIEENKAQTTVKAELANRTHILECERMQSQKQELCHHDDTLDKPHSRETCPWEEDHGAGRLDLHDEIATKADVTKGKPVTSNCVVLPALHVSNQPVNAGLVSPSENCSETDQTETSFVSDTVKQWSLQSSGNELLSSVELDPDESNMSLSDLERVNDAGEPVEVTLPGIGKSTILPEIQVGENDFKICQEFLSDDGCNGEQTEISDFICEPSKQADKCDRHEVQHSTETGQKAGASRVQLPKYSDIEESDDTGKLKTQRETLKQEAVPQAIPDTCKKISLPNIRLDNSNLQVSLDLTNEYIDAGKIANKEIYDCNITGSDKAEGHTTVSDLKITTQRTESSQETSPKCINKDAERIAVTMVTKMADLKRGEDDTRNLMKSSLVALPELQPGDRELNASLDLLSEYICEDMKGSDLTPVLGNSNTKSSDMGSTEKLDGSLIQIQCHSFVSGRESLGGKAVRNGRDGYILQGQDQRNDGETGKVMTLPEIQLGDRVLNVSLQFPSEYADGNQIEKKSPKSLEMEMRDSEGLELTRTNFKNTGSDQNFDCTEQLETNEPKRKQVRIIHGAESTDDTAMGESDQLSDYVPEVSSQPQILIGNKQFSITLDLTSEYVCENEKSAKTSPAPHAHDSRGTLRQMGNEKSQPQTDLDIEMGDEASSVTHKITEEHEEPDQISIQNKVSSVTLPGIKIGNNNYNISLDLPPEYACEDGKQNESNYIGIPAALDQTSEYGEKSYQFLFSESILG